MLLNKMMILILLVSMIVVYSEVDNINECKDGICNDIKEKTYDDLSLSTQWKDHLPFFDMLVKYYKQFSSCFYSSPLSFKVVDLGVGSGYTSLNFATKLNNSNSHVYGIDIYLDNDRFRYDTHNNLISIQNENMLSNLSIIIGEWNTISRIWSYPIDILNIDVNSNYDAMKLAVASWSTYVKRDGIILIHDTEVNISSSNNFNSSLNRLYNESLGYYRLLFTYSTGLLALTKNMDLYKRLRIVYGNSVDSIEFLPSFWKGNGLTANFLVALKNMTNGVVVDLGIDYGYSTYYWANALKEYANNSKVYGIDSFNVNGSATYDDVLGLISNYNVTNIEIIQDNFEKRAKIWDKPIDILNIDGFHDLNNVQNDYNNWAPHVKEDGIIVFHDLSEISSAKELQGTLTFFNSLLGMKLLLAPANVNNGCEIPPCSRVGIYTKDKNIYDQIFSSLSSRIIFDDFVSKIPSSSSQGHRVLIEWLANHKNQNNNVVVQLGVDHGFSLLSWALALRNSSSSIYGIEEFYGNEESNDSNGQRRYKNVMEIMRNNGIDHAEIIVDNSSNASKKWGSQKKAIDILHIEGLHHTYETIKVDYDNWSRYLKNDSTIFFHFKSDDSNGAYLFFKELDANKTGYTLFFNQLGLGLFTKDRALAEYILAMFKAQ